MSEKLPSKKYIKEFFKKVGEEYISKKDLQKLKTEFAKKYHLKKLPLTSDILQSLNIKSPQSALVTKPARTLSGVTVIAVMSKPYKCPGKCIFCPNYKNTPKSYTGFEPAAMRGKRNDFDPYLQIKSRLSQLAAIGHPTNKIELIIMGGTFPATPINYQKKFMIKAYQAITNSKSENLEILKKKAMHSRKRVVGVTFETRPDYCDKKIIQQLLSYGGTRVEIGVQTTCDKILKYIQRGHTTNDVICATEALKDSGFKVLYHMMLNLPKSNYKRDMKSFQDIFDNQLYCPDMLKIYPCVVTKHTKLEKQLYSGDYNNYTLDETINLIADIKEIIPPWVRIMRIQRDIPADKIISGVKKSNLRELVQRELKKRNKKCNCIRCNEPTDKKIDFDKYKICVNEYLASNGTEWFITAKSEDYLLGFIRLRFPYKPFIKELTKKTAIVRELHIYGLATEFHQKNIQHRGLGKKLLETAEDIAKNKNFERIAVISGIGVREYYQKQGYKLIGNYVIKKL